MDTPTERRVSCRLPISSAISCKVTTAEQSCLGTLKNLSVSGCYVELDHPVSLSDSCETEIVLYGEHSRVRIEGLTGDIIRSENGGVAIRFASRLEWFVLISSYFCNSM